ncbi:MAG: acetolactate synthase small subunit [Clostridiales bacterium]|nr:acetolactate synthase small subunit [Clostridiales bacterium]MCD7828393.1 acetolactate synthase small subunit [Clostridiales bacterium]
MDRYILAVLVKNHFGVLARVASMFRRRGFNIDTLTVGETEDPEYSRITVTFTGDDKIKNQIASQLMKMPDVENVVEHKRGSSVSRELVLIKINNTPETRQDIMSVVDVFRAKVIDYAKDVMTIEITGESSKIDAFIDLVREFGIIEVCRTGIVSLERGKKNISQYDKD